jgi:hypothetical protein
MGVDPRNHLQPELPERWICSRFDASGKNQIEERSTIPEAFSALPAGACGLHFVCCIATDERGILDLLIKVHHRSR